MVADVSSLVVIMKGYKEDDRNDITNDSGGGGKSGALITQDLLGERSCLLESTELDLDLQVPSGWEKRLDLMSGKVYLQRCNFPIRNTSTSSSSSSSSEHKHHSNDLLLPKLQDSGTRVFTVHNAQLDATRVKTVPFWSSKCFLNTAQDLNFPPSSKQQLLNLFNDSSSLDLKLNVSSPSIYQSVCTLDKVKSALQGANKESTFKKRSLSPSVSSSSSTKETVTTDSEHKSSSGLPFATGCPSCLLYIVISSDNHRCPKCNVIVPSPTIAMKKPRIDLNLSVSEVGEIRLG